MPDEYTLSGGGEEIEQDSTPQSEQRRIWDMDQSEGSSRDIQAYNSGILYNTISCPCSSYAINLDDGNIMCEMDDRGVKRTINSIPINNHLIAGSAPKIGDKWLCANIKCNEGNFKWDTLHVVKVTEGGLVGKSSSLFNSEISKLNCYAPQVLNGNEVEEGIDVYFKDILATIDGRPLYADENIALAYTRTKDKTLRHKATKYDKDGLSGYLPGGAPEEKLITSVFVNGKDVLGNVGPHFKALNTNEYQEGNMIFKRTGDIFSLKIKGINSPTFTLSLKDSSGCDVLQDKYKNIVIKGAYDISEVIPPLPPGGTSEIYDLKITIPADTKYLFFASGATEVFTGVIDMKIYQYKDAEYTFTVPNSTLSGVTTSSTSLVEGKISPTSGNSTFSGNVNSESDTIITHTTTLSHANTDIFVKNPMPGFHNLVTRSNVIKKYVVREDSTDTSEVSQIMVVARPEVDSGGDAIYQGDIKKGMIFSSEVTKTKTIRKSVDLDIHKEPCDDCPEKDILTNKFEIDNTSDIFEDMIVSGVNSTGGSFSAILESIDCDRGITLSSPHIINNETDLTFEYNVGGTVGEVRDTRKGQLVSLPTKVKLPNGSEMIFENGNTSNIAGYIRYSASGAKEITVTTTIHQIKYGQEDVTFTLNIDDFISFTPNDGDQYVTIGKNATNHVIDFFKNNSDIGRHSTRTVTILSQPKSGTITTRSTPNSWKGTYTPNPNFTGKDKITFFSHEGEASFGDDNASEGATIFITVK
jgi:hypothetical protein